MSFFTDVNRKMYSMRTSFTSVEKSTDVDFEEIYEIFSNDYKKIIDSLVLLRQFNISQRQMAEKKIALAESLIVTSQSNLLLNSVAQKYKTTCECVLLGLQTCITSEEDDIFLPLKQYTEQYRVIEQRIKQLKIRQIDMDRFHYNYSSDVKKSKPQQVITDAKTRYEQARDFYFYLRNELIDDITKLNTNYPNVIEPLFVKLFQNDLLLRDVYNESFKSVEQLLSEFKKQFVDVKHIITNDDLSCIHPQNIYTKRKDDINNGTYSMKANNFVVANAIVDPDYITDIPMMPSYNDIIENNTTPTVDIHDVVKIYNRTDDWWEGELNGVKGFIPSNFLEPIK
ncbi:Proline-serine-threonine phosphatase interacting protein [Entamoeba marina]